MKQLVQLVRKVFIPKVDEEEKRRVVDKRQEVYERLLRVREEVAAELWN